jgi:hypothetical protein
MMASNARVELLVDGEWQEIGETEFMPIEGPSEKAGKYRIFGNGFEISMTVDRWGWDALRDLIFEFPPCSACGAPAGWYISCEERTEMFCERHMKEAVEIAKDLGFSVE